MVREKLRFQDAINFITDVLTVLLSYVTAVVLRYKVMKSEPGLDALSAGYLLIAFCYSLIMAAVFQYARTCGSQRAGNDIRNIWINATGCLIFLGFFYVIGEIYFSRIALVLFWLISSFLLEVKWNALSRLFNRGYAGRTEKKRILLVGGGEVTCQYIRALGWDETCSFRIIGYVGKSYGIFYDDIFESGDANGDISERGLLGDFDSFEGVLEEYRPDEVVFALEEEEVHRLKELIPIVRRHEVCSCLVPGYIKYMPEPPSLRGSVNAVTVDLEKREEKASYGICLPGVFISTVLLLLMMVIDRFDMGNVDGLKLYDSYRAFVFGISGFFVYRCLKIRMSGEAHGGAKAVLYTLLLMLAAICVYESFYTQGINTVRNIVSDAVMTVATVMFCGVMQAFEGVIGKSDSWMYM